MPVFSPQNEVGLTDPARDIIAGWVMQDEPDNAQRRESGKGFGPPVAPKVVISRYQEIKSRDASRPVLLNLGQGVAWDGWYGRGVRTNHPEDYEDYVKAGDIVSFDIYPATHDNPALRGRLDLVAKGVGRLVNWTDGKKPVWSVIGASHVDNAAVLPTGNQIRNMVWLSIVHGARGIIYFVHEFSPRFSEAGLLNHPGLMDAVTRINARITGLARVLNSPDIRNAVTVTLLPEPSGAARGSVSVLVKETDCHLYIFAGSRSGFPARADFSLAAGRNYDKAEVLDENRTIAIEDGRFIDEFDPYAVHLYRLALQGAICSG
ncbi:MAG: hypothetical protein EP348_00785 [Alphaproteobacteria bacterium]|nr:MAG: hypothetical protein EP348_00785 [Alphaproteobacteria bacterium]